MKKQLLLVALVCAATPFAYASTDTLDDIVVTATRTAQSADATLASVTVITRRDIERMQAQSVQDALRGVAGLTIANNGGAGKATSVFLRGTNSDHVLVLIDGIKIGSATLGTASFQDIPVEQIERIEIVRGPRASLYGSEAIGGVIQIFTRKATGALMPSFSATAGRYGTTDTTLGLGGGDEQGWFSTRVNYQNTSGFNACRGSLTAGCFTIEPDKDGYRNTSLGLNGGYRFDNGVLAEVNALRADSANEFDGSRFSGNESDGLQQVLGGSVRFAPTVPWQVSLRGGRSWDKSKNFFNGAFNSRFNTRRDNLSWQNDFAPDAEQLFSVGLDYLNDHIVSTTNFARTTRSNTGLFAQYQGSFGAHSLQASARHDDNQQFGGHDTGGVGYGYRLDDTLRLMASYGTAFKAPTFNQLYFPGFGSASLRPERSRSVELGVSSQSEARRWSVNVYRTKLSNLIGFDALFNPVNIDTARLTGAEGQFHTRLDQWEFDATLTLQNPRQTSGVNDGKILNRRAQRATRLELARAVGDWRVASALYAEGKRYDNLANSANRRLGGYGLLDARIEYRLGQAWQLQARADNLLDKRYETAQYFNQARRGVYLTLNYQPGN